MSWLCVSSQIFVADTALWVLHFSRDAGPQGGEHTAQQPETAPSSSPSPSPGSWGVPTGHRRSWVSAQSERQQHLNPQETQRGCAVNQGCCGEPYGRGPT